MSAANLVQIRRLLAELAEPARVVAGAETFLVEVPGLIVQVLDVGSQVDTTWSAGQGCPVTYYRPEVIVTWAENPKVRSRIRLAYCSENEPAEVGGWSYGGYRVAGPELMARPVFWLGTTVPAQ